MRGTHEDQLAIALRQRRTAWLRWFRHALDPISVLMGDRAEAWKNVRRSHRRVLRARRGIVRHDRWLVEQNNLDAAS